MKTPVIVGICVVILIIIFGAWYVYTNPVLSAELGLHHAPATSGSGGNRFGMGSTTPSGRMQGGFVTGSIEILNDSGFTITLANGDTKNITLVATSTIENYASASSTPTTITADQLSVGEQVQVIGTPNSDGSITARTVRTGAVPARGTGGRRAGGYGGQQAPMPAQ